MEGSSISGTIRRASEALRVGASSQVSDYEKRFSSLKNVYDGLLSNLLRMDFQEEEAYETAKEFFGGSEVRFAGIDGTMYSRPLFDLVVFFGGAYASTGTIKFQGKNKPLVDYDIRTLKQAVGISSIVPVYVSEIPDIDQAFYDKDQPTEADPTKQLTDQSIINNATIANWIMTFAEFYLAYKLAIDSERHIRVILLDRSLSIERASLIYETSDRNLWKSKSSLIGYELPDDKPIDENDITIARQTICNDLLRLLPARADYLQYAIFQCLRDNGSMNLDRLLTKLGIDDKRAARVQRCIARFKKERLLIEQEELLTLDPTYKNISDRIKRLVTTLGERLFFGSNSEKDTSLVMKIRKKGEEHWLTTVDISFLTLFTLHLLMEECWKRHVLLIGVTKDTAARDFKRQLIPILRNGEMLNTAFSNADFDSLPNTDRMILQSTSLFSSDKIRPPWSLIEYDSAFRTMVPDLEGRKGFISGAIKNRTSLERVFLKTYVQLSQAKSDPLLRSNVLLIDRLAYGEYDYRPDTTARFLNEFSSAEESVECLLFKDNAVPNRLQTLVMSILIAMAPSSIPEAFGHNKPLFIADKVAKWNYNQFKCVVDTTASWMLNNHKLRRFIFYMSSFRERRAAVEAARRESV